LSERLPPPDGRRIAATQPRPEELLLLEAATVLVRVHPTGGPRPKAWDEFRFYGPTKSRFDHQTLPRRVNAKRGIAYLTIGPTAFVAAIAEYFQDDGGGIGPIDRHHRAPAVTTLALDADLTLLDLESGWVTRAGGNQAITSGPRGRSRDWSRALYRHVAVDGLSYGSSVWAPGRCVALWERARHAFPAAPLSSRLLSDPLIESAVAGAADDLKTGWV
jgi:hypothetical protein